MAWEMEMLSRSGNLVADEERSRRWGRRRWIEEEEDERIDIFFFAVGRGEMGIFAVNSCRVLEETRKPVRELIRVSSRVLEL